MIKPQPPKKDVRDRFRIRRGHSSNIGRRRPEYLNHF